MIDFVRPRRLVAYLLAIPSILIAACDSNSTGPGTPDGVEVAVVLNSVEVSLTVIPVDDPAGAFTIGLSPEGTPEVVAVRGSVAVVPLGIYPFAAVVDLVGREVVFTVPLPDAGASGAAFLNDSIALVGNPALNTVTPVNVRRGTTGAEIAVGPHPHKMVSEGGRVYVLNANLEFWAPAGPGSISVIDQSLHVVDTIELTGENPGAGAVAGDGRLYVVNSGSWGAGDGSLSIVNLSLGTEIAHHSGLGDFPGAIAGTSGRAVVGLYGVGILEWNTATSTLTHGPANPLTPGEIPPVSGVGFDSDGRLFAMNPGDCDAPGKLYRLSASGEQVVMEAPTGICPFGLVFTVLEEE